MYPNVTSDGPDLAVKLLIRRTLRVAADTS
jgi:hypothetical protein